MSIKVQQLCKEFGTQKAVNNISFEIGKGTIVGFLGPNGAGKSTTMRMLSTYIFPSSGKAWICGREVSEKPQEVRRLIGYLPESNPLYYDMYVREYLEFASAIHKLGKQAKSRIDEIIISTGLQKEVKKKIGTLSKGYKQRVGIAQAMIHNPEVLILDEPTSGLDPNQIMEIRNLIIELGKEKTVLLSTHIMQEVEAMCSRVIIINNGLIVADDSMEHIQSAGTDLIVEFDKPVPPNVLNQLDNILALQHIEHNKWQIKTNNADLLRKELMKWSLEQDMTILSLQNNAVSLESVFRNLTGNN